jgi:glycosyltransferase involved in cell wall biosynthesis
MESGPSEAESSAPLVAIGLPVYNSERYVAQSIESILNQTFHDFILFISDNASTDGTGDICRDFARRDSRIRYHRNPTNIGLTENFNRVFRLAESRYFRWATSDDYSAPEMLADAVEILEGDPSIAVCYPRAIFIDAEGRETGRWKDDLHLLQDDPLDRFRRVVETVGRVHHHLGLTRTSIVRKTALMGKHTSSDVGFLAELSLYGKFYQVPKYQFYRRLHEDSSSWTTTDETHQARRYHPANVSRIRFDKFRFHWRYVAAVGRSPLGLADKTRAYVYLMRRFWWRRKALWAEARQDLLSR